MVNIYILQLLEKNNFIHLTNGVKWCIQYEFINKFLEVVTTNIKTEVKKMKWTPEDIKGFKERHNLTAESMGNILGVTRSYIFLLIKGEKSPSKVLCKLLDMMDEKMTKTANRKAKAEEKRRSKAAK